jgi:tau tubulin kinase
MLSSLFERCMKRRGVKESDPYDWEKPSQLQPAANQTNAANNIQTTNIQTLNNDLHANITQMTVAGSNASGIEYVSGGL